MALRGNIDLTTRFLVGGWAFEPELPDRPVSLLLFVDGELVARGLADRLRPDLIPHIGTAGRHGFDFVLPRPLSYGARHVVMLRREDDGAMLPSSPRIFEAAAAFDETAREEWRSILAAADTEPEFEVRLAFLTEEAAKLRAGYARRRSGVEEREHARRLQGSGMAAAPNGRPRALVLDIDTPDVRRDAGSNAIVSHIHAMQRLGYDVSFASAALAGDAAALEAAGVEVYKRPLVESVESLLEQQRGAYAAVYLHRVAVAERYLGLARAHQPRARIVYSVADLHHLRLARQAAVERRPELLAQAERAGRQEVAAAWGADAVVTHSRVEAQWLARRMPEAKIFVVPWAVEPRPVRRPFAERAGLAFVAGFAHPPNVDAAHWLARSIMPEVWRRAPEIKLRLVGSQLPPALRTLASERVEIVGFVADLAEVFERVRLTAAPLAFGAGLKGKVLDSLAAGVPCVCTPVAAEGFSFAPPLAQLVAANPEELAGLIVAMHEDESANAEAAAAGLRFVAEFASQAEVDAALGRALGAIAPK